MQAAIGREHRVTVYATAAHESVWAAHEVGVTHLDRKRFAHPSLGALELYCQTLLDPDQSQVLLVFTAVPGSPSYEKLQLLAAVGD